MTRNECDYYQQLHTGRKAREDIHNRLRAELNRISLASPVVPEDLVVQIGDDVPWKAYIALHPKANDIIGLGILKFTAHFMLGTKDPNWRGQLRLDFVVEQSNGDQWRLHPGTHSRNDMAPHLIKASVAKPGQNLAEHWNTLPKSGLWTVQDAATVPQIDLIGKREAWKQLRAIRPSPQATRLDLSLSQGFLWWLWISNLGKHTSEVIGPGLISALAMFNNNSQIILRLARIDDTFVGVRLHCTSLGEIQVTLLDMDGTEL